MADGTERPSKWEPTVDQVDLAILGKLGEETGELTAILSRMIIQGVNESDPETGKPNRQALQEEIADVMAMGQLAIERFNLNRDEVTLRAKRKIAMKVEWIKMLLEEEEDAQGAKLN